MAAVAKIDTQQLKSRVDLRELAERHTELHRESSSELSGACPKCAGADRFHVTAEWFMCRQCHSKRGDAIEFMQWLHGVSFAEACSMLAGGNTPAAVETRHRAPQRKPQRQVATFNGAYAAELVAAAHDRLFEPAGEPAQHYLRGRGIEAQTWLTFGLGYVASSPTAERAPAVVLPWYRAGELVAVRFRFLQPQVTVDKDGAAHTVKIKSLKGSSFTGCLFGGQAQPLPHAKRTLLLCEGELNAVSIWQQAHEAGVDVLSVGSETQSLPESLINVAERYGTVLTWFDKAAIARSAAKALPGAHAISSPGGKDANDLLRENKLGYALAYYRQKACSSSEERERLLWQLYDSANSLHGIDAGTAQIVQRLASELGKEVQLFELWPERFVTAEYARHFAENAGEFSSADTQKGAENE